jgi:aspartate aminotransferase
MNPSENVVKIQPSATIAVSTLAGRLRAEGRDIVDFSAGQPDFDTPSFISDAGVAGIRAGGTRYTPAAGLPALRKAIAENLSNESGREVDPAGIVVSCGAKHALFNAIFSLFGPGDEVMIASPYWTSYPEIVRIARAEPTFVAGSEERGFRVTPQDLESAATPKTRGLVICSPVNPTGSVYSLDEFRAVAEWARDRGITLISDEIYRKIRFDSDGAPAPGLLSLSPDSVGEAVLVDGVSKSYAMTGWRIGFTLSDPALASTISALQSHITSNPSSPAQFAALAAYSEGEAADAAVSEMRVAFERRRDLVVRLFQELLPGISFVWPQGAFYLFFRVDNAVAGETLAANDFCAWLLEESGVAIVPGEAFGDPRYARMSFAAADEVLEDGIRRMAAAIDRRAATSVSP